MARMNMKNGKKVENPGALLKRLMGYIMKHYGAAFIIVLLCILISVVCNVQGTMFMQTLIDNYIVPMLKDGNHDFSGLAHAITRDWCSTNFVIFTDHGKYYTRNITKSARRLVYSYAGSSN